MKLEQQKHIEKITSRQDLVDVLQYIWRKFEVILNRKKVAQNYLRLYHQYIGTCKMINMLRKGIKFSIQRVYFPQSYFESRHYGKRFNSFGKFKSLTFQLRPIYFHTFAVDMSVVYTLHIQIVSYTLINIKSVYKINVLYVRYTL